MIEYRPGSGGTFTNKTIAEAITELAKDRGREGSAFLIMSVERMLADKVAAQLHQINGLIARTIHGLK